MTLYEFLEITKCDYDTNDTEYDTIVTVCHIGKEKDNYDRFCNELMKKVEVKGNPTQFGFDVNWSELIKGNMNKFKTFTKKHWKENCQYEDDEDEFVFQWIKEFHNYMAGNVPEDFYATLVEFVQTLTPTYHRGVIVDDDCWDSADYVEKVTGKRPVEDISLEALEEMELSVWNYPLTEIGHIIENELTVVLVRFPEMYGGYEYRFCELPEA